MRIKSSWSFLADSKSAIFFGSNEIENRWWNSISRVARLLRPEHLGKSTRQLIWRTLNCLRTAIWKSTQKAQKIFGDLNCEPHSV